MSKEQKGQEGREDKLKEEDEEELGGEKRKYQKGKRKHVLMSFIIVSYIKMLKLTSEDLPDLG
jgi:hypothetical protein